jgi:RNA polymerase sigma factor for flagellar operon FliA
MRTDEVPTAAERRIFGTVDWLRRSRRPKTAALRARLVEAHRGTVEAMARRLALRLPPSVDVQDLVHAGIWGLMRALDRIDVSRLDQFPAFMRIKVRCAMLDELRNMDFLPRLYRRRLRDREEAIHRLRSELLREPSEEELAQELGVSREVLQRSYSRHGEQQSMNREHDAAGDAWDAMEALADDVESPIEAIHRQEIVAKIQASLSPIEWRVLKMHYLDGMSGKEVARRLRLSASRICQIHGQVLCRLKTRLAAIAG